MIFTLFNDKKRKSCVCTHIETDWVNDTTVSVSVMGAGGYAFSFRVVGDKCQEFLDTLWDDAWENDICVASSENGVLVFADTRQVGLQGLRVELI